MDGSSLLWTSRHAVLSWLPHTSLHVDIYQSYRRSHSPSIPPHPQPYAKCRWTQPLWWEPISHMTTRWRESPFPICHPTGFSSDMDTPRGIHIFAGGHSSTSSTTPSAPSDLVMQVYLTFGGRPIRAARLRLGSIGETRCRA